MRLEIDNESETYELEMLQITQMGGLNLKKKNFIINSLIKHFSNSKYMEYESKMMNNVRIDSQDVGRKYFDLIYVRNKEDIINMIKITKSSMMLEYIRSLINTFEIQVELDKVENALVEIYHKLNLNFGQSFINISFDYEQEKIMDIVNCTKMKSISGYELESIDSIYILRDLLILVEKLQNQTPKKQLYVFENIDHMIDFQEYSELFYLAKELTRKYDIWFLFTSSIDEFIVFEQEYFCGINIINDVIFSFQEIGRIRKFIENRYPIFMELEEEQMLKWLKNIVQKIGKDNMCSYMKSSVLLKLLNESLCIDYDVKNVLNSIENSFLLS